MAAPIPLRDKPGAAEKNSHFCEDERHLCLAYDDDDEEEEEKKKTMNRLHSVT